MTPRKPIPSRKVRKEKQKAVRQTVALLGFAVVTLLVFVFIIIPIFINGFNSFLDSSNPFEQEDKIPPQVPIISAPVEATFSAQIAVSGFGEPESKLIFILNGEKFDELTIAEDGTFEAELDLIEGENTIAAYSVDEAGNESEVSRTFTTLQDATDPLLDVSNIEDGMTVETRKNQNFSVEGTTDPGAKVYINGRVVFPNSEGGFRQSVLLAEGENILLIEAVDKAGNRTSVEKKVTYIP